MDYVHTFTGRQLAELTSALRLLIAKDLLEEEEKKVAGGLIEKFEYVRMGPGKMKGEPYATVHTSVGEEELLANVEVALWSR